jgi:hypothetical protein
MAPAGKARIRKSFSLPSSLADHPADLMRHQTRPPKRPFNTLCSITITLCSKQWLASRLPGHLRLHRIVTDPRSPTRFSVARRPASRIGTPAHLAGAGRPTRAARPADRQCRRPPVRPGSGGRGPERRSHAYVRDDDLDFSERTRGFARRRAASATQPLRPAVPFGRDRGMLPARPRTCSTRVR